MEFWRITIGPNITILPLNYDFVPRIIEISLSPTKIIGKKMVINGNFLL
jgi:hypothetical protein